MKTKVRIINGVEEQSIHIGDIRVAGPKAWGGGKIIKEWNVEIKDIVNALNNIFYPPHQPKGSAEKEAKALLRHLTPDAVDAKGCDCSWDYVTGESPNYFCGKCGQPMRH